MSDGKHPDLLIYEMFPRRVGRRAAMEKIKLAVKRVAKERGITDLEARRFLYAKTRQYANSPAGQNPDKTRIPHAGTWFNQGRYDDDPSEWQIVTGDFNGAVPQGKANQNLAVLQRSLERGKRQGGPDQDGMFPAGGDGRRNAGSLHSGAKGS